MNVLINTSTRFLLTPDGRYWAPSENLSYRYWTRFLDVFDEVRVLARVVPVAAALPGAKLVSGCNVTVEPLPNYCGIPQYVSSYRALRRIARTCVLKAEAIFLLQPCIIGDLICKLLPSDRPFGLGVCGDPYEVFAPASTNHPLRWVLRWHFSRQLRRECELACACSYVTRDALQARYPPRAGAFSTHYSSIDLTPDAIADAPLESVRLSGQFHLLNVGSFDAWYKGPDTLLHALTVCCNAGLDLRLTFIGEGRHRPEVEKLAETLGVSSRVRFLGQLPFSAAVRAELDTADLFVLPSRTEGLPKALIEAMARGLPCIASAVGGVPELLSKEDLVVPNDPAALADRIMQVIADPERRLAMSAHNLLVAREYRSDILRQRRIEFYRALRMRTEEWLTQRTCACVHSR